MPSRASCRPKINTIRLRSGAASAPDVLSYDSSDGPLKYPVDASGSLAGKSRIAQYGHFHEEAVRALRSALAIK